MDLLDHQVLLVQTVLQVTEEFLVYLVQLDLLDPEEHQDLKEKEEMLVQLEKKDLLDQLVPKVHQDLLVPEEKGVKRDHLANKEHLVWEVDLETKVLLVQLVLRDLLVPLDFL